MRQRVLERRVGKDHRELLAAVTERSASAVHLAEASADHPEKLIAGVMTPGVVERLEVIDVDHRDRIDAVESLERLVQGSAARQAGELVGVPDRLPPFD